MDWLLGRKPASQNQSSSQNPSPAPVQPPQLHHQQQEIFEAPDIDSLLKPHDPAALHPLANLDKQTLDYIILEDEQIKSAGALPSRGWTDDLCYGTGTTYLTALGVGGMWGVIEALRKPVIAAQAHSTLNPLSEPLAQRLNTTARVAASAAAASTTGPTTTTYAPRQSGKLLLNNILNHVTRRGPFLGNSAGVLAMTYNIINAYVSFPPSVPVCQSPFEYTDLNGVGVY